MKFCILASGSKGNVIYLEVNNTKFLIDVGKSKKYIELQLENINVDPQTINFIIISHLHKDHISALETFIRKYKVTVVITTLMLKELPSLKNYDYLIIYEDDVKLDDLKILSIKSSHDSVDSRNFIFQYNDESLVYLTDTGYVKQKDFKKLTNKNVYLFESNHDIEMLQNGPYPKWLKARVLSDYGHLSNITASYYLTKLIGNKTKMIYLMHLSETNNKEELALQTINETFTEYNIKFKNIKCAKQDERSEVIKV